MTHIQLKSLQDRINFDGPSMAACLGVTHDQYRHYLYGHIKIPPAIERAALELEKINMEFVQGLPARVDARIDREHPHGIMSGVCEC